MDVAGYGLLMEQDEERTHRRLMQIRFGTLEPAIAGCAGRTIKNTGDGLLAVFETVDDALRCAAAMQAAICAEEDQASLDRRVLFRIGINYCDAILEADDVFGDGVNVAARLQAYAEPGDIVVSANALGLATVPTGLSTLDLGDLRLKHHAQPVRAYSLRLSDRPRRIIVPDSSPRPAIAVMPFGTLSASPDDAYFGDGMVEDIIRALGSLRDLVVIARTSTLSLSTSDLDLARIGRELRVRYVLTGSVRRDPKHQLISTQLWEAETGAMLASHRYRGTLEDLFHVQDEIAFKVVAGIAPHVREHELRRVLKKHPDSLDAYDLTLQGLDLLYRLDHDSFSRARDFFQRSIALDADYATAYAHAAMWHILRVGQGWSRDVASDSELAATLAAEAIERDKYDALGLATYGHAQSWLHRRFDTGMAFLDRAIAACPSSSMAWCLSSCTCSYLGDGRRAVERGEHALRLSPVDQYAFWYTSALTLAYYVAGSYEEAIQCGHRSFGHNRVYSANLRFLIVSLVAADRIAAAKQFAYELMTIEPEFNLAAYASRCPMKQPQDIAAFVDRLRRAGLPG